MEKMINTPKPVWLSLLLLMTVIVIIIIPEKRLRYNSPHFRIIYSSVIQTDRIIEIANALEENYGRISGNLKTIPSPQMEVNVYAPRWRYIQATGHWDASGNIEGTSKLHFVEQPWGDSDVEKVAVHEFTHAVVLKLLLDNEKQPVDAKNFDLKFSKFPVWLWEAVSVYEAGQFHHPKMFALFANGSFPNLHELNDRSKSQTIYDVGYTITEYILHEYGNDKLVALIKSYGDLNAVLDVSEKEFTEGWHEFVEGRYLKHEAPEVKTYFSKKLSRGTIKR